MNIFLRHHCSDIIVSVSIGFLRHGGAVAKVLAYGSKGPGFKSQLIHCGLLFGHETVYSTQPQSTQLLNGYLAYRQNCHV